MKDVPYEQGYKFRKAKVEVLLKELDERYNLITDAYRDSKREFENSLTDEQKILYKKFLEAQQKYIELVAWG